METTPASRGGPGGRLRIAMALYGDLTYDSRVLREAATLSASGHDVTVCCLAGAGVSQDAFRVVSLLPSEASVLPDGGSPFLRPVGSSRASRLAGRVRWVVGYVRALRAWGRLAVAASGTVDVWHAHDLTGLLAVGPFVKRPARLVYDSHEIFLETGTAARLPGPLRLVLAASERYLVRRAFALVTVNEDYARVLRRRLRPRRTIVVRNCPPQWTPSAGPSSPLRDGSGMRPGQPLILYHGAFSEHRGIEQLAEALTCPGLESAHLVLLGVGSMRPAIEALAGEARFGGRIHVLDAVPPDVLLDRVADADVDVMALQRSSLNHYLCTPNKLWESLTAGVPVVVSDFPTMRRVVLEDPAGPLGVVCDPGDPASIAAAIRAILDLSDGERAELRARCRLAAEQRWNWGSESSRLVTLYAEIAAAVQAEGASHPPDSGSTG